MASSPNPQKKPVSGDNCPCGSGQTYGVCCESILTGRRSAGTAEELMRARFTAHVVSDLPFLHRTYLPTAKLPYVEEGEPVPRNWTKLVIHAHEPGPKPDTAYVEFSAYFTQEGAEGVHDEKAEFVRTGGEWIFSRPVREGPAPVRSSHPKPGRNDPCPCGSGKKYKHCCL